MWPTLHHTGVCVRGEGVFLTENPLEGYVFTGVSLSTGGGGWQASPRADTPWADIPQADTPWADTPQADTPLGRHPPGRHPLGRHPPAQCMLGDGQQVGGTHPTGMHSC